LSTTNKKKQPIQINTISSKSIYNSLSNSSDEEYLKFLSSEETLGKFDEKQTRHSKLAQRFFILTVLFDAIFVVIDRNPNIELKFFGSEISPFIGIQEILICSSCYLFLHGMMYLVSTMYHQHAIEHILGAKFPNSECAVGCSAYNENYFSTHLLGSTFKNSSKSLALINFIALISTLGPILFALIFHFYTLSVAIPSLYSNALLGTAMTLAMLITAATSNLAVTTYYVIQCILPLGKDLQN
jgi:hypothetical protein